jgi:hypothetical protein
VARRQQAVRGHRREQPLQVPAEPGLYVHPTRPSTRVVRPPAMSEGDRVAR